MPSFSDLDDFTRCSRFSTSVGCDEYSLSISTPKGLDLERALAELSGRYSSALGQLGLSDGTAVFCRIFLSDFINQSAALLKSALHERVSSSCALSVIEQKPLGGGPVSLLAYHVRGRTEPFTKHRSRTTTDGWHNELLAQGQNYSLLYTANHTGGDRFDAYDQTKAVFASLNARIEERGMTLLGNGIRTWVYLRDLDNHYGGMVRARREWFEAHGLTEDTRYLASTGILGMAHRPDRIVSVDSLSIGGLSAEQIVRMEALTHLWPTILYGVTFERGLRVRFGDRSHLYLSGTASINPQADVLHVGDAERQTLRAVENVRALLGEQSATVDDLVYVIVYVRNSQDQERVRRVLCEQLGSPVPLVFVEAAVCRPAWLVEIEGVAIIPDTTRFPPFA